MQAGIRPGDHVLKVDGESCAGLTVAAIREKIVGLIGSKVVVTLESASSGQVHASKLPNYLPLGYVTFFPDS